MHTMSQIENVAGAFRGLVQNILRSAADFASVAQQHARIQVTLDSPVMADCIPGLIQAYPPVDSDHRTAAFSQQRQQRRIACGKVNERHAWRDSVNDAPYVGQYVPAIVVWPEAARPGIE